jgi:hypothetical protein
VPKSATKTQIRVKVDIKPVKLADVTPAQRQQWKRWWSKLFSEIRDEAKSERKSTIFKPNVPGQYSGEMREKSDAQG